MSCPARIKTRTHSSAAEGAHPPMAESRDPVPNGSRLVGNEVPAVAVGSYDRSWKVALGTAGPLLHPDRSGGAVRDGDPEGDDAAARRADRDVARPDLDARPVRDESYASTERHRDARVDDDCVPVIVVLTGSVGAQQDAGVATERRHVTAIAGSGRHSMQSGREALGRVVAASGTHPRHPEGDREQAQTAKDCHVTPTPGCSHPFPCERAHDSGDVHCGHPVGRDGRPAAV
ncbi:hypothetical protein ACVW00_002275 [Marmoricola sp. URHA0025 HA25]